MVMLSRLPRPFFLMQDCVRDWIRAPRMHIPPWEREAVSTVVFRTILATEQMACFGAV